MAWPLAPRPGNTAGPKPHRRRAARAVMRAARPRAAWRMAAKTRGGWLRRERPAPAAGGMARRGKPSRTSYRPVAGGAHFICMCFMLWPHHTLVPTTLKPTLL